MLAPVIARCLLRYAVPAALTALWFATAGTVASEEGYVSIAMQDNVFRPEIIRVPVGSQVEWHNDGGNVHNVVADDGSYDSGNLEPGQEFTQAFNESGVYTFTCTLHGVPGVGGMIGTIVVGDVPIPTEHGDVGRGREPVPTNEPSALDRLAQERPAAAPTQAQVGAERSQQIGRQ